jgi:hypothetical protein
MIEAARMRGHVPHYRTTIPWSSWYRRLSESSSSRFEASTPSIIKKNDNLCSASAQPVIERRLNNMAQHSMYSSYNKGGTGTQPGGVRLGKTRGRRQLPSRATLSLGTGVWYQRERVACQPTTIYRPSLHRQQGSAPPSSSSSGRGRRSNKAVFVASAASSLAVW